MLKTLARNYQPRLVASTKLETDYVNNITNILPYFNYTSVNKSTPSNHTLHTQLFICIKRKGVELQIKFIEHL